MKDICSKCGEAKEIIVIGLPAGEEETHYFCKHCAETEGYIKPYSQVKCQHCGSTNGKWTSIYDWHCNTCGKVTVD